MGMSVLIGCTDRGAESEYGSVMMGFAQTTAALAGDIAPRKGSAAVLCLTSPTQPPPQEGQMLRAVQRGLGKEGFSVSVHSIPVNPALESTGEAVTAADFIDALAQQLDTDVVVSLVGIPRLDEEDVSRLPPDRPPLVVASLYDVPYAQELPRDVLKVLIYPREEPTDAADPFERHYQIQR